MAIINHGVIVENTSIKNLLKQLNKEVFILDTQEPLSECPVVEAYDLRQVDESTLEVEIEKGRSLNALFMKLSELNIDIVSMRNKVNRLEELFVSLVNSGAGQGGQV